VRLQEAPQRSEMQHMNATAHRAWQCTHCVYLTITIHDAQANCVCSTSCTTD
jgi:hypothetical protein